jgi:hypothetical protein
VGAWARVAKRRTGERAQRRAGESVGKQKARWRIDGEETFGWIYLGFDIAPNGGSFIHSSVRLLALSCANTAILFALSTAAMTREFKALTGTLEAMG